MEMKAEREEVSMKVEREEVSMKVEGEEESSSKRQKVCMELITPESRHYYLARQTLLNILGDRGYVVPHIHTHSHLHADPCNLRLTAHRASDFSRKIVAIFCEAHQTNKQDALGILSQIVNKKMLDKLILVLQSKMSSHAQKVLDAYPVQVETFMILDLLPKFEMLSRDEKDKLLMNKQSREAEMKAKREERSRKRAEREEEQKRQKEVEMIRERYYSARRFLMEMFTDRGYVAPGMKAELALSLMADFHVKFGDHPEASRLSLTAHRASDPSRKIVAIFCEAYQTKREHVVGILSGTENKETLDRVILVMQCKMDVDAQKVLDEYPVKVETFMISELQVNILRMEREPEYEFYSREEGEKLSKNVEVQTMDQSLLCPKYYGLEKGQLLKASRTLGGVHCRNKYNPGIRSEIYFRVV